MQSFPVLAAGALLLAACVSPAAPPPQDTANACGAEELQGLAGQPLAAFDPAQARGPVRIIGPDTAVTMDHSPARLNISHGADLRITAVTCG